MEAMRKFSATFRLYRSRTHDSDWYISKTFPCMYTVVIDNYNEESLITQKNRGITLLQMAYESQPTQ